MRSFRITCNLVKRCDDLFSLKAVGWEGGGGRISFVILLGPLTFHP